MDMKDIIFVPTIQHTGTWFLLKFLNKFVPHIRQVEQMNSSFLKIEWPTILHTHFPFNFWGAPVGERDKTLSIEAITLLSNIFKTVIPIRDPLAAILTRECRHPNLDHFYIVDNFIALAQMEESTNIKFFPIDIGNSESRMQLLLDTAKHCSLTPEKVDLDKIAGDWIPENITPNNKFTQLYRRTDMKEINYLLGSTTKVVDHLKNNASIILPFMEKIGYMKGDLDLW